MNRARKLSRRTMLAFPAIAVAANQAVKPPLPPTAKASPKVDPGASLAAKLAADHQRPKYHFLPKANWMNDPNGPIFWHGSYHMFYQHNPRAAVWGDMHWGHAISPDMVHWRHLPIALAPTPHGADKDGVFSGCCVDDNGEATMVYTGVSPEVQCIAISRDGLTSFKKRKEPVIAGPPEGMKVTGFRDPCVWKTDGTWYMALGSGIAGKGGMVLLYSSADLVNWTYLNPLYEGKLNPGVTGKDPVATGEMFECPSFFPLGDKHVLFVSTRGSTPYWVGTYKDQRFEPESDSRLDWGAYYAPITQLDDKGRRILWGWIQERRSVQAQKQAGWSGVLSLPRLLQMTEGKVDFSPAPQVRSLRQQRQQFVGLFIPDHRPVPVPGLQGDALELIVEFELTDAEEYGVRVLCSPDGNEFTPVVYNRREQRLSVGTGRPGNDANLVLGPNETLRLRIFVDCSVLEIFGNGRMCLTERAYTSNPDCTAVSLWSRGGTAKVKSIVAYDMKPISNDRLTT